MEILGIVGSYRKSGNTDILVQKVLEGVMNYGLDTNYIFLPDFNIKDCTGCERCKVGFKCVKKDDMQKLYPLIEKADAIVIGSPTYFYNVTGVTKNFLNRLYCYEIFDENDRSVWMGLNEVIGIKYAVTVAVCEQEREEDMGYTSLTLSKTIEAVGYRVIDNIKALHVYSKGDILNYEDELKHAILAGEKLAKTLMLREKVKSTKII
ncbi:multimeric flavodoxin WrbA [Sedimentibacter acidaminivorans]|uniref:Multimeric flavodoxin WrbA n=1 Tax=Sedimentibacter acidaminivorans TaxID=913099 RepID=A0ABS4GAE8_9FIRM|nr:flavodoxin family protein [Sedimentibacter acidaminivorans]MBP1924671.1 multimeric flavodoxin WrbA [Sedimentibacter acidaminivorans]